MPRMKISGVGMCVPERVVTNADLESMLDTSDEWIRKRTGIEERRWAPEDVQLSDLAVTASERALADAGVEAKGIDLIVFATLSAEMQYPGTGVFLQAKLGVQGRSGPRRAEPMLRLSVWPFRR